MRSLSVTNTTVLITWDPPLTPNGDSLVYEVHYQGEGGQEGGRVVNVTATSVELTGLRPESTYTISVRAYTAAGPGEERRLTVAAATTNTCQLSTNWKNKFANYVPPLVDCMWLPATSFILLLLLGAIYLVISELLQ